MDIIQLVFGFVNAPLFATFLLGMFWERTTGTGAFLGLFGGIGTSALFHALTIAAGQRPRRQRRLLCSVRARVFPATWRRTSGWPASPSSSASSLTLVISLATQRTKTDEELKGLVYSLTPKLKDEEQAWYLRPAVLGIVLLVACVILNIIFW